MAGDVYQQPFSLSFQADSLHSGSISFGRFEVESLSWERRSSFSHNRYLEEVEKYAKPGSVMEKAAFLEAHFRRKGIQRQASSESHVEKQGPVNENGLYSSRNQQNDDGDACHFDESPESSCYDGDSKGAGEVSMDGCALLEAHLESVSSIVQKDIASDLGKEFHEESVDKIENLVTSCYSQQTFDTGYGHDIEMDLKSNDQSQDVLREECNSVCKEAKGSGLEILPTHAPKLRAAEKTRSPGIRSRSLGNVPVSRKNEVKKGSSQNIDWKEKQTTSRMRPQKEMSKSTGSFSQSSIRISKKENPPNLKVTVPAENISEKDLKPKRTVTLQPSTPERTESRGLLSAVRTKQVASINKEIKRCSMNSSFRLREGVGKNREEKKGTEIRQVGGNLNSKPKLTSSTYYDTVSRGSNGLKSRVIPNSNRSSRPSSKSSHLGDQRPTGAKACSGTRNNQAVSPSKSEGSNVSTGRSRNRDLNKTTEARTDVRKEEVHKDKVTNGKKQGLTECRAVAKGRSIKGKQKVEMGRSGNAILRKNNIGHLTFGVAS